MSGDREKEDRMTKNRALVGVFVAVLFCVLGSVASAAPGQGGDRHSEQIVFSGTGFGDFGPFGFWIWCQDEDSSTPYAGECAGAMYFYALHLTKGVEGDVEETSEGIYTMTVHSRKGDSISCTLVNDSEELTAGPTNSVTVMCTAPTGNGTSDNAVINVTGPSED
jgi:hypothetical protein